MHSLSFTDNHHISSHEQSNRSTRNTTSSQCSPTKQSNMNQISHSLNHLLTHYLTQTLTTIDLSHNRIGVQGAKYLANALEENEVTQLSPFFL
jgi:hypothetical protein